MHSSRPYNRIHGILASLAPDPLSRTFQQRIRAIHLVRGHISATVEVRFRKGGTVREEVLQGINNISNVHVAVVITVTGIQARTWVTGAPQEVSSIDRISNVVNVVPVTVAAKEWTD